MQNEEIESKLKSIKPYLIAEYGIDQIGYFGSFARGDYNKDSDLDILVSFKKRIGWKFFDLKEYLELVVGRKVDLVTERSLRRQWKETILEQVIYL
ncbi:nucleotidyltransferase family protein [Salmonirosea aquatica]|uniref:Nucleotidyltransferase n=1 Tax=Salmonirosea aquatica TaxID=2654236 RepID=A0A7C9F8B5_9BACT|nr:nucleotidyltransferase [Cytophagaceae bacterium SJW1-29]